MTKPVCADRLEVGLIVPNRWTPKKLGNPPASLSLAVTWSQVPFASVAGSISA